jgi:L,D-transpeptidase catalytic domain
MERSVRALARGMLAIALGTLGLLLGGPLLAGAEAAAPAPAPAPTPAPSPTAPAPPGQSPPGAPAPVAGSLELVLQKVGGKPPFALVGQRVVVRGIVTPYVGGQSVKVTFTQGGRQVGAKTVAVLPIGNGSGQFHIGYVGGAPGLAKASATHAATPQQGAFGASSPTVRFVSASVGPGSHGQSVRVLQSELNALHYAVPLNGVFDEATGRALVAYRKMTGLARIPAASVAVFTRLQRGEGAFHVRYTRDGRHVEANLTRQVLAEIEPGGRVHEIYTMSSGKPSTPTVVGHFSVYMKTPGVNSEGMVDSNYFIRGYAIHGYAEVPTYAASHGCLRVPIPDAPPIFAWIRTGTPVDVYDQGAGGSRKVRGNAGP